NRGIERGLLAVLREQEIGCIAFSPLAQGLLTDRYLSGIPADSRAAKPHGFLKREEVTADVLARVRRLTECARARGQTLAQMALAWVLRHPEVTAVLVGASRPQHIADAVAALTHRSFASAELRTSAPSLAQSVPEANLLGEAVAADAESELDGATLSGGMFLPGLAGPIAPFASGTAFCTPTRTPSTPVDADGDRVPDAVHIEFTDCAFSSAT